MPEEVREINYSRFLLPFGPVHPSLKEPLGVRVSLNKEIVESYELSIGFANRGIEKLATSKNIIQAMHLIERVCGICSSSHSTCFTQAIESIGAIEPSGHARHVRTLVAELERIHSHLLCVGITGYQLGFDTFFMDAFAVREKIMDIFERVTGNRIHHGINSIGGLRIDVDGTTLKGIEVAVTDIEVAVNHLRACLHEGLIRERLRGTGVIPRKDAERLNLVGPVARASGVTTDIRKDAPYAAYGAVKNAFSVITMESGDAYARNEARILEIGESCKIIRAVLDTMPEKPGGKPPHPMRTMKVIPAGTTRSTIEAPRGSLHHDITTDGNQGLGKVGICTPTLVNIKAFDIMLPGVELADVPIVLASIDPCISCMDR